MSPDYLQPHTVCLDASTACQLRCPACPTATRTIKQHLHNGTLSFENFRTFVQDNPFVEHVELSNWGELFINPELLPILRHAHERGVSLSAENGVNFNHASEEIIRALVQYRFRSMTVSIDGVEQDSYATYRRRGRLEQVLANIRLLNHFKQEYASDLPRLRWQFIAFGHNQQDITRARELAAELNMEFYVKLSWDDLYTETFSPVTQHDLVRRESNLQVADRREYAEHYGEHYAGASCYQLWLQPRINFDGRLLGCSINYWDDFGNVFEQGLTSCLASDKMQQTRRVLQGKAAITPDIPCSRCQVFAERQQKANWVSPAELKHASRQPGSPGTGPGFVSRLRHWFGSRLQRC